MDDPAQAPPSQTADAPKTPKEKAEAFVALMQAENDVTPAERQEVKLDAETFQYLVEHKMIVEARARDLTYQARKDLIQGASDPLPDGHYQQPVYIVPGIGVDRNHAAFLSVSGDNQGGFLTLVTEGYHEYDAKYMRKNLMFTDASVAQDSTLTKSSDFKAQTPEMQARYDALLAGIEKSAKEDGIGAPHTFISSVSETGAAESTKGTKYLFISQKQLAEALADKDPQKLNDLNEEIKGELLRIKSGETSAKGTVTARNAEDEAQAMEAYKARVAPEGQDHVYLPDKNAIIRESSLKQLAADGTFIQIHKKELEPSATHDPVIEDALKKHIPVYLVAGAGAGSTDAPQSQLMHTQEGKPYVLVNERDHKWTEKYASANMQDTDAGIQKAVDAGNLTDAKDVLAKENLDPAQRTAMEARLARIEAALAAKAGEPGIGNVHLKIDTSERHDSAPSGIASATTREGTNNIFVTKEYLMEALASNEGTDDLIHGNIGRDLNHELGHIRQGDTRPEGTVRFHDVAAGREGELRATLDGSGPLGSRDAEGDAQRVQEALRADSGPGGRPPTDAEVKAESDREARSDPVHPSRLQEIAALREEAALMKTYESKFLAENGHAVTSPEERQAEAQAVINQVMRDMRDKVRMDPEPPPAPANHAQNANPGTITPAQQAHIDDAKSKVGEQQAAEVHAPSAPMTPATNQPAQQATQRA